MRTSDAQKAPSPLSALRSGRSGLTSNKKASAVLITGATASGKTDLVHALWRAGDRIVSADSKQVYKHLNLGTAKPKPDDVARYRYDLIDDLEPGDRFSAYDFLRRAASVIDGTPDANCVFVVGGASLYTFGLLGGLPPRLPVVADERRRLIGAFKEGGLAPLLEELAACDPEYYAEVDQNNPARILRALEVIRNTGRPFASFRRSRQRLPIAFLVLAVALPREGLYRRINDRADAMFRDGFVDEVEGLLASGVPREALMDVVGYREIVRFLSGETDLADCVAAVKRATRLLARRQMNWLRNSFNEAIFIAPSKNTFGDGDEWLLRLPWFSSSTEPEQILGEFGLQKKIVWEGAATKSIRALVELWGSHDC